MARRFGRQAGRLRRGDEAARAVQRRLCLHRVGVFTSFVDMP